MLLFLLRRGAIVGAPLDFRLFLFLMEFVPCRRQRPGGPRRPDRGVRGEAASGEKAPSPSILAAGFDPHPGTSYTVASIVQPPQSTAGATIVENAGKYRPEPAAVPKPSVAEIHDSDLGNARRLVAAHGSDIRYVTPWKDWLIWDDVRWRRDETGSVVRRAKTVVNKLYACSV